MAKESLDSSYSNLVHGKTCIHAIARVSARTQKNAIMCEVCTHSGVYRLLNKGVYTLS